MSGHSKWSTIKHKKGAQDAKRGKVFTKVIKEITVAARMGGGGAEFNPRLRAAIQWAKSVNMPNDNITRAVKKGSGESGGDGFVEIIYEGYGPGNTAIVAECLTDNTNRSYASVRTNFNKNNGSLGAKNSVLFQFDKKGLITIPKNSISEDELTEHAIEAGSDDIITDAEDFYQVITEPSELHNVQDFLDGKGIKVDNAELSYFPQNPIEISDLAVAQKVIGLIETLEDNDDVQKVYSNFEISDEILSELMS